jgi:hypothetical protein
MMIQETQSRPSDVPQLRVFFGDDSNQSEEKRPPDPAVQAPRQWRQLEAYWAGRIPAGRRSARLAA